MPTDPSTDSSPSLHVDIDQRLGNFHLQVSLALPAQGVTGVFGTSGSGKTSLMRVIAGLEKPDQGRVQLGERTLLDTRQRLVVPAHKRRIGVVFQEARLFPHYRVRGNLTYGMPAHGASRFDEIVALLGIAHLLERLPGTLSGGESRRVAIGRALLSDPRLLLMDEPLTGLDGARKQELLHFIARLARQVDIPIIYVSHDPDEIATIADHLVLMKEGSVRASDALGPLLQRFDLTRSLAGFEGASLLEATVIDHDIEYGLTRVALDAERRLVIPGVSAAPGERLRLRLRAGDVTLVQGPLAATGDHQPLVARIEEMATLEDTPHLVEIRLGIGDQCVRARLTRKARDTLCLAVGQAVTALIKSVAVSPV